MYILELFQSTVFESFAEEEEEDREEEAGATFSEDAVGDETGVSDESVGGGRVGPDLVFLAGCRISGRIIRHALLDVQDNAAFSSRIQDMRPGNPALPDIRPNPSHFQ